MSATIPRKALISISSYHGVIYPDGTKTGLFYTEALHPFEVLTRAGFDVDLATETGSYGLDDLAHRPILAGDDKAVYENPDHPFNVKLNSHLKKGSGSRQGRVRVVLRLRRPCRPVRLPYRPGASKSRRERLDARESSQPYATARCYCPESSTPRPASRSSTGKP